MECARENLRSAIGFEMWTPRPEDIAAIDAAEQEMRAMAEDNAQPDRVIELPTEREEMESAVAPLPEPALLQPPAPVPPQQPALRPPAAAPVADAAAPVADAEDRVISEIRLPNPEHLAIENGPLNDEGDDNSESERFRQLFDDEPPSQLVDPFTPPRRSAA